MLEANRGVKCNIFDSVDVLHLRLVRVQAPVNQRLRMKVISCVQLMNQRPRVPTKVKDLVQGAAMLTSLYFIRTRTATSYNLVNLRLVSDTLTLQQDPKIVAEIDDGNGR